MTQEELSKVYDPSEVEDKWYSFWLAGGCFAADPKSKKKPYSIVIPPPNVTGILTLGHILNNTLQDILCRRKRMEGREVLWLPGTDHAGIATQTVVERTLKKEGQIKHRDDLGREKFLEKIWEWKDRHGGIIIKQLKKLGCSCDWDREVFTMDGLDSKHPNPRVNYSECVQKVFVDLYKKGFIYRGKRMVNWCPVSRTALSDEEVVMKEVDSQIWYLKYPIVDSKEYIIVATTRPETMLGDEAVAVNPKDKRYKNLVGKKVLLPLQNKQIPIIKDELVELEFGTGAVKVTPAHDLADYEMGVKHNLPLTVVIGHDGRMTEAAGEKYEEMDRFECRESVVRDLEELGLLEKIESYKHNVGYSQRADVPVEPMVSEQWFLKYPCVKKSLKAVTSGKIGFWPERWNKVYSHWMEGIRDWCISRQLWWGHRIPAWHCTQSLVANRSSLATSNKQQATDCPPTVSIEKPNKCPKCGSTDLEQDPDVLDTWFSSWLWPFATMGWPEKTDLLKKFYPTTDLVTGPDIIFFWVARMIMAGFQFMGKKPFDNVYYTGIIRDSQGRKMSKSLGNSPNPLDLIDKYGADGLRFGLMLVAPKGQDILFSEDRIEVGRNFMNKLWNASRFIMMNLPDGFHERTNARTHERTSLADKWILNCLQHTINDVNKALDTYQFDTAARSIYQFVWGEYCDWYIELAKTQFENNKETTLKVLIHVLDNILRLLHPYAPFITEEIWQKLRPETRDQRPETIMYSAFPKPVKKIEYEIEAKKMQLVMNTVASIRNIRGEHNVSPSKKINVILTSKNRSVIKDLEECKAFILELAKISELSILHNAPPVKKASAAVAGPVEIFVPLEGMIDLSAEKERLAKEIVRVEKYAAMTEGKLSNKSFVDRAPKDVVEKERARLAETRSELEKLNKAMSELS